MEKKTLKTFRNEDLTQVPVTDINPAQDIADNIIIEGKKKRIIRIAANNDVRIWAYYNTKEGNGTLIPAGSVEYFAVWNDQIVEIQGDCNLME